MIYIIAMSLLNAIRGRRAHFGGVSKPIVIGLMTLVTAYALESVYGLLLYPFMLLGFSYGWGRYFSAFHGSVKIWNEEEEVPAIAWLLRRMSMAKASNASESRRFATWGMALRMLLFYPMYIALGYVYTWNALWIGLLTCVAMAGAYAVQRYRLGDDNALHAELIGGAVFAISILLIGA